MRSVARFKIRRDMRAGRSGLSAQAWLLVAGRIDSAR
jgi:hypothetical protein